MFLKVRKFILYLKIPMVVYLTDLNIYWMGMHCVKPVGLLQIKLKKMIIGHVTNVYFLI